MSWLRDFRRRWLLPPGVHDALSRTTAVLKQRFSPSWRSRRALIRPNLELRNRYRGRRCFVIGNGPSLARQDLAPLGDEVTIVMNAFHRHPIVKTGWRPTVHCMADPATAYDQEVGLEFLRESTSVSAEIHLFPTGVRNVIEEHGLLPGERVRYVDFSRDISVYSPRRLPSLTEPLPYMSNTAHLSIAVAMYLGCSPIYLLGLDHDWLAHRGIDRHFYAHQGAEAQKGGLWDLRRFSYLQMMEFTIAVYRDYMWLKQIAEHNGIEIYNATGGGFLDVFDLANYAELVAAKNAA